MTDEKLFTIQEVAEKLERSTYTIGRWQKEGHVKPIYKKDPQGRFIRYFTEEDVKILEGVREKKIKSMLSGKGEE